MTHDELLAEIDDDEKFLEQYFGGKFKGQSALRAVVELHKPVEITTGIAYTQSNGLEVLQTQAICAFCKDMGSIEHWYPCPTIQAIEKELK